MSARWPCGHCRGTAPRAPGEAADGSCRGRVVFSFVFASHVLLSSPLCLLLSYILIVVTQIRGDIAGASPPSPLRGMYVPCIFIATRGSALSSLVDSRRIAVPSSSQVPTGVKNAWSYPKSPTRVHKHRTSKIQSWIVVRFHGVP